MNAPLLRSHFHLYTLSVYTTRQRRDLTRLWKTTRIYSQHFFHHGFVSRKEYNKKISIFDKYLTTSWKLYKIRPYGRRIETRMRSTEYRMVSVSVTLSDPSRSWHSSASNNSKMLQHRAILKMARCVWTDHRPHRQPACLLTGDLSLSIRLQLTGVDDPSYVRWVPSRLGQVTAVTGYLKS